MWLPSSSVSLPQFILRVTSSVIFGNTAGMASFLGLKPWVVCSFSRTVSKSLILTIETFPDLLQLPGCPDALLLPAQPRGAASCSRASGLCPE